MTVELVPFKATHAEEILAGDQIEQWSMHSDRLASVESYTLLHDGNPAISTGVIELWPGVGEAWMLSNDILQAHPLAMSRAVKRSLFWHIEKKGYWRVQANVRVGWPQAEKFAEFVGMKREGLMPTFGQQQEDHYRYAWVK